METDSCDGVGFFLIGVAAGAGFGSDLAALVADTGLAGFESSSRLNGATIIPFSSFRIRLRLDRRGSGGWFRIRFGSVGGGHWFGWFRVVLEIKRSDNNPVLVVSNQIASTTRSLLFWKNFLILAS